MNARPTLISAVATFLLAGTARAQSAPAWYPQPTPVHLSIQAPPFTELEIVPADAPGSPAVARCSEYCDFWAWPGKYTLYSRDNTSKERRELPMRVKQSGRYVFEAGDADARATGLAVGIAGTVAIGAGFAMMIPAIMSQMCEDTNCTSAAERRAANAGLVVLLAGVVSTPIGWTMYVGNRTRLKRVDDGSHALGEPRRQVRVSVVGVGLGGIGLGGLATF